MSTLTILILGLVTLIAGTMRGFSGFGGGLMMAPVFSLFLSPADVVVVVMLLNLPTTMPLLLTVWRSVRWHVVMRLFVPAFFGVPIGVAMLHVVDPVIMRKVIASIVTVMASLLLLGWTYKGTQGHVKDGLVGLLSGFLTSIGGVGGPPVVLYLLSDANLSQYAFRANILMFFFLLNSLTLIQIGIAGSITMTNGVYALFLLPVYALAHVLGARLFHRWAHRQDVFRNVSLWSLLSVGLLAFFI